MADPRTQLHLFAKRGELEKVQSFLGGLRTQEDRFGHLKLADEAGELPCHHAARRGRVDVLMELLPADDHNLLHHDLMLNRKNRSSLHLAASHGQLEAVNWILTARLPLNLELKDEDGNTPLHLAVFRGRTKAVHLLVDAGASQYALNEYRMMPVSYCCNADMFQALFHGYHRSTELASASNNAAEIIASSSTAQQAPPADHTIVADYYSRTVLHYAAEFATDANILSCLISSSKNDNQLLKKTDNYGDTFLHVAAKAGNMKVLEALKQLEHTASLMVSSTHDQLSRYNPALVALLHEHRDFFDELVTMGTFRITLGCIIDMLIAELIHNTDIKNELVLLASTLPTYLALFARKFCVFDFILERRMLSISQWDDEYKRTCLHWAVIHNRPDIVEKLRQNPHLRPGIEDRDGKTAMHHAFERKNHEVLEILRTQPCFKDHEDKLYRDRGVYVQALNAILVGAALITSVTFAGWLQRPGEPRSTKGLGLKIFWASNSFSFLTAVTAMWLTIAVLIRTPGWYVGSIVKQLRLAIACVASLLVLSLVSAICAFATAGFLTLHSPHISRYEIIISVATALGATWSFITGLDFALQFSRSTSPSLINSVFRADLMIFPFVFLIPFIFPWISNQALVQRLTLADVGSSTRISFSCKLESQIREDRVQDLLSYRAGEQLQAGTNDIPHADPQLAAGRLEKLGIPNNNHQSFIQQVEYMKQTQKQAQFAHRQIIEKQFMSDQLY